MSAMKSTCSTPVPPGKLVPCPADFLAQLRQPLGRRKPVAGRRVRLCPPGPDRLPPAQSRRFCVQETVPANSRTPPGRCRDPVIPQWASAISMATAGKPKWCLMRDTRSSWSEKRMPSGSTRSPRRHDRNEFPERVDRARAVSIGLRLGTTTRAVPRDVVQIRTACCPVGAADCLCFARTKRSEQPGVWPRRKMSCDGRRTNETSVFFFAFTYC